MRRRLRVVGPEAGTRVVDDVEYTWEPVAEPPSAPAEIVYRVETYIELLNPEQIWRHVHYVPAPRLDDFFDTWGEHAETVVAIRPITRSDAENEPSAFRERVARERG